MSIFEPFKQLFGGFFTTKKEDFSESPPEVQAKFNRIFESQQLARKEIEEKISKPLIESAGKIQRGTFGAVQAGFEAVDEVFGLPGRAIARADESIPEGTIPKGFMAQVGKAFEEVSKEFGASEETAKKIGIGGAFVAGFLEPIPGPKGLTKITKTPAYKSILKSGFIETPNSWGNEYFQIRGKIPENLLAKGVQPHVKPRVEQSLEDLSKGIIETARPIDMGIGKMQNELIRFQTDSKIDVFVDRKYLAPLLKEYPDVEFRAIAPNRPVVAVQNGEVKGVVMPTMDKYTPDVKAVRPEISEVIDVSRPAKSEAVEQSQVQKPPLKVEAQVPKIEPQRVSQPSPEIIPETAPVVQNTARAVGDTPKEASRTLTAIKKTTDNVLEYVQDEAIRVRRLIESGKYKVTDDTNIYQKMTLFYGRVGTKIENAFTEMQSLVDDMARSAQELGTGFQNIRKEVNEYLVARHAPERNKAIGEGAAGITTKEAQETLARLEASPNAAKIKQFADKASGFNKQTLNILRDSGVISDDLHKTLTDKYKHHVPLQRVFEEAEDIGSVLSGRGFEVKSTGIKGAKGSEREVADVLASIMHNYEQAVIRAEKNLVDQATLKFVRDNEQALKGIMEETRLPIVPVATITHKAAIDLSFQTKLVDFAKSLGARFRQEGQPGRRLGVFEPSTKTIARRFATPREVISHETAHFFDDKYSLKQRFFKRGETKQVAEEMIEHMKRMGESNNRIRKTEERFADAFEWWLTHRELARRDLPLFSEAMEKIIKDIPDLRPVLEIEPTPRFTLEQMKEVIFREQQFTTDPTILSMFEKGKKTYIKIHDPHLAIAVRGVGREKLGTLLQAVGSFTRLYSGLATRFNPEFALPNKIRDLQETAVFLASQKDVGFKGAIELVKRDPQSWKDVVSAMRGQDTEGARLYKELKELGGTTGGFGLSTRGQVELKIERMEKLATSKTRRVADNLVEYVDNWNTIFEDSTRLSVYKQARSQGLSKERAAFLAKEASINFNKMGKGGPLINALYMFSNASIQGSAKMIRSLKDPKVLATVMATVGGSVAAVNEWNDRVDPNWRDFVSKWDRLNGLPVVIPSAEGENFRYFTIPVSWGLKPIKVMTEYAYDAVSGAEFEPDKMVKDTLTSMVEAYNPAGGTDLLAAFTPTIGDVPVEIARNVSWTGNKIRPDFDPNAPRDIQYFDSLAEKPSGRVAISISEALQQNFGLALSPADMHYAFEQYIGGAGRAVSKASNTITSVIKREPIPLDELPLLSRFYRERTPEELGGSLKDKVSEVRGITANARRESFQLEKQADTELKRLSELPSNQMVKEWNNLAVKNPDLVKEMKGLLEKQRQGLTSVDKAVRQLGVENGDRAKYILGELSKLPQDQITAKWNDYVRKRILTPQVMEQIVAEMQVGGATGLEADILRFFNE